MGRGQVAPNINTNATRLKQETKQTHNPITQERMVKLCKHKHQRKTRKSNSKQWNKLASLGATLVRNYDPLTHLLTDRGKV